MNCISCKKELHPPRICREPFTSSYYCSSCREEFIVWEGVKQGDKAIQWQHFRIYCDHKNNCAQLQQLYMDIESDTSIMYRWATILNLPKIPQNLDETNIESKIKLYLLFS